MAITTTQSAQLIATSNDQARAYPIDKHGKVRMLYGLVTQGAAAGDDGSFFEIGRLPQGRKRIIPWLSRYKVSALGAARVMKFGHRAYYDRSAANAAATAENDSFFFSGVDVSAAVAAYFPLLAASAFKLDMFSRDEIMLFGTITGGTIPAAATFEFMITYLYE